jgi:hypothetical protein
MVIPALGASTEIGKDVLKSLSTLSKHVPPGSASQGTEASAMQKLMLQQKQQAPMLQAMQAMGQGGQTGSGMPLPPQPGAAPPAPPAPPPG